MSGVPAHYVAPRADWLDKTQEDVLAPDLAIVDAHHHLWDRPASLYMPEQYLADLDSGHKLVATVYVDCRTNYRVAGPAEMAPVGEVEFAGQLALASARDPLGHGLCAGIVGHADLGRGAAVREVLEAQLCASAHFRGIRHRSAWHTDETFHRPAIYCPPRLLLEDKFREGFAQLAPLGLSFDAYLYFSQLSDLVSLARTFPETSIILNHLGGLIGVGVYAGKRDAVFREWKTALLELAKESNVTIKLGGLGMVTSGFDFHQRESPPTSQALAEAWRPYIDSAIEIFGPSRAMFESNFPPDKGACSYRTLWNAFKRLAEGYSAQERAQMFSGVARRVYRLAERGNNGETA
jgi:predicted TIM-barrel fold metal-dependent hydrolase